LCQFLVEKGANVNYPLPDTGETPLHNALCRLNHPSAEHIIKILLTNGADSNCKTRESVETGSFMRDCRTKAESPLHRAAAFGSQESIKLLLDSGAIIDAKDMNGETPLGWASWYGRPAHILEKLCYGDYSIHPTAVEKSISENAMSRSNMEINLLGKPHV
jgi:ankyrin repeat protein